MKKITKRSREQLIFFLFFLSWTFSSQTLLPEYSIICISRDNTDDNGISIVTHKHILRKNTVFIYNGFIGYVNLVVLPSFYFV